MFPSWGFMFSLFPSVGIYTKINAVWLNSVHVSYSRSAIRTCVMPLSGGNASCHSYPLGGCSNCSSFISPSIAAIAAQQKEMRSKPRNHKSCYLGPLGVQQPSCDSWWWWVVMICRDSHLLLTCTRHDKTRFSAGFSFVASLTQGTTRWFSFDGVLFVADFMSWETQHRSRRQPNRTTATPHCLQRHLVLSLGQYETWHIGCA